jgi:CheY-like chemotaxis protein
MAGHRILVIEDNPADTRLLRCALDECGEPYTLEVLPDGGVALQFIREHCHPDPEPCLIVLDLHLPKYDGAVILRAIRSDQEFAHVAVVVLTNTASPSEEAEVRALGVRLYRRKPMEWADMVSLARELIDICKTPFSSAAAG